MYAVDWMGMCVQPYTITPVHVGGKFHNLDNWMIGLQVSPNNMMTSCLETANHHTLFYRSILNAFDLFDSLHMLWMGIWVHPYTVTPVHVGTKFQNLENWG